MTVNITILAVQNSNCKAEKIKHVLQIPSFLACLGKRGQLNWGFFNSRTLQSLEYASEHVSSEEVLDTLSLEFI